MYVGIAKACFRGSSFFLKIVNKQLIHFVATVLWNSKISNVTPCKVTKWPNSQKWRRHLLQTVKLNTARATSYEHYSGAYWSSLRAKIWHLYDRFMISVCLKKVGLWVLVPIWSDLFRRLPKGPIHLMNYDFSFFCRI